MYSFLVHGGKGDRYAVYRYIVLLHAFTMSKNLVNKSVSRFRPGAWLADKGYAPHVYLFRNLERGQVVYSQMPVVGPKQSTGKQFAQPSWDNRLPPQRRDLWKCMAVVAAPSYASAVQLFQNLTRLRHMRDVQAAPKAQAQAMRKKNEFGRVWYSGQFRPVHAQEAVADLREALLKLDGGEGNSATVYWEDPWRMGDLDTHWKPVLPGLKHEVIARDCNTAREESQVLKELGLRTLQGMRSAKEKAKAPESEATSPQQ